MIIWLMFYSMVQMKMSALSWLLQILTAMNDNMTNVLQHGTNENVCFKLIIEVQTLSSCRLDL